MELSGVAFSKVIVTVSIIVKVPGDNNLIVPMYAGHDMLPGETIGRIITDLIEMLMGHARSKAGVIELVSHSHSIIALPITPK